MPVTRYHLGHEEEIQERRVEQGKRGRWMGAGVGKDVGVSHAR